MASLKRAASVLSSLTDYTSDTFLKAILELPASEERYVQFVRSSAARYENKVRKIAKRAKETGTVTLEMIKEIDIHKNTLLKELGGITPLDTTFKLKTEKFDVALNKFDKGVKNIGIELTKGHSNKRKRKMIDATIKKANSLGDKSPKIISSKAAKFLRASNKLVVVTDIASNAVVLLTSKNQDEQKKALIGLSNASIDGVTGVAAAKFCVVFGAATGGFGYLACGATFLVGGVWLSYKSEQAILRSFAKPAP